jgi:hypothetical protein
MTPRFPLLVFRTLVVVGIVWGVVTVYRTACLSRKMGDLDVYLRAGWAVRVGVNPYDIVCDNAWHYSYPPPYAILMAPLADPPVKDTAFTATQILAATPSGPLAVATALATAPNPLPEDTGWYLPFVVSTTICYLLNVLALVAGVHLLASALERARPGASGPPDAERWWWLRLTPIAISVVPIAQTLMRGQVNTLVLFLICGMLAGLIAKQSFRAGLYLGGAIALKIIPGFLLLLPFWLRDRRCLAGTAAGLLLWLGVFPLVTIGPARTLACYDRLFQAAVGPALRLGGDNTRSAELINTTATDNQSFGAVLHAYLYPDRFTRPGEAAPWTRKVHWGIAGLLTLATLLASGRGNPTAARLTLLGGALTTLMILSSPVCHLHYLMLLIPAWMGLMVVHWDRQGWQGPATSTGRLVIPIVVMVGLLLPTLPSLALTRDFGLDTFLALAVWGWAVLALARSTPRPEVTPLAETPPAQAA